MDRRTSIDCAEPTEVHRADEAQLRRYPLLYLAGADALPAFDDAEVAHLRRHLQAGWMLIIDGARGRPGRGCDQTVRSLIKRPFPHEPLERVAGAAVAPKAVALPRA